MLIVKAADKFGRTETDILSEDFLNSRRIWIQGEINAECAKETITALSYLDRLSAEDITVMIDSPGGAVSEGFAILDAMKRCRSDIVTVATGLAASMGAFLFAVGGTKGKRYITRNAEVMIHQPLGGVSGQATEIALAAQHILRVKTKLNTYLSEATGKTVEEIARDTERDFYMDAGEAVGYGLADKII